MDAYIETIQKFKPRLLVAYPGPLEAFSTYCQARDVRFESLVGIVSSAESLWPNQRKVIEDSLGVRIFDRYGSREVAQVASECGAHDGYHVSADCHLVEIVDEDGNPCQPGIEGKILVTDLNNFGMPFIRYEIGDRGIWRNQEPCSCGRGFPRLEKVTGRTLDVVRTPDGGQIGGTFWTLLLRSRPGFRQFQVIQNSIDGVVVEFVADYDIAADTLQYFSRKIREHTGNAFSVRFKRVSTIKLTKSGKQRIVVSNVHAQTGGGA
jgi:phenylacetate-CoA ligase